MLALSLAALVGCITRTEVYERDMPDAIAEGVAYLVKSQQEDGSWGAGKQTRGFEIYASVPGSHHAFRVATTALCVMALREAGETEAHGRGLEYLVTKGYARRDTGDIIYNVWAHTYALQALAVEMRHTSDPRVRTMAEWHLDHLVRYETVSGGWFYYDFDAQTQTPSEGTSSFNAAAGLVALWEAKQSGLAVPTDLVERANRRLEECRLPNGAYLYGLYLQYRPLHPVNMPQGSIGRTQACNYALWLWNSENVGEQQSREGLEDFFKHHAIIEIGRKRQYPHEAWFATSGYFYYFGHYYAGLLLEKMGEPGRREFGSRLAETVLPHQEPDGSWWDYAMWDYHKPYGTAYALMTLLRCGER